MRRRVVITGMGAVTPLADSVADLYRSQIEARSGVTLIEHFEAQKFPTKIAAQIKNFQLGKYLSNAEEWKDCGPNTRFALAAAKQALEDAGLLNNTQVDRTRLGVYMGTGEGQQEFETFISLIARTYNPQQGKVDTRAFAQLGRNELTPGKEREQEAHTTPAHIAQCFDCQGPNYNCLTACAASSQAIGEAVEMIRHDDVDMMLAGGSHSMIHPFGVTGFNLLTALSTNNVVPTKASKPFDANRDGFVLGEGSGMLVLEELEHAKKRGATIYAEMTGYGSTADAFAVTDSHPEGRGAIACLRGALADSGLKPTEIGYINAHGTSTQVNDRVESIAIKQAFGEHAYRIPVSSSKSMLGHLIAAAGAVELIISVMALRQGVLPPTINYEVKDPNCDLDYIPNTAREKRVDHVVSNSFGFGGQNISLIASRYK